ncbi:MAG: 16S rRNA (adenine(1518)-N(6)/adenine(1519)-N(6))-dimethyltransferase RsmA [Firmicutes bacterium]|nr:16S rRNA (adenine(1518)-N(6)/adenine(1519)-N(6))-dimethyltransferase RsmA [Bacillota bacterium]
MSVKQSRLAARTLEIIRRYGLSAKRRLGQHFLVDEGVLAGIIDASQVAEGDIVLEIGPGIGTLTEELSRRARSVIAVEVDEELYGVLRERLGLRGNVVLVHGDILAVDLTKTLHSAINEGRKCKAVANLPYYITTPTILKLLDSKGLFERIVVMVQKEVAERMAARPGGKDYGAFSIAVQFHTSPEIVSIVPSSAFLPEPEVDSAVVRLKVRTGPPVSVTDQAFFFAVVRAGFQQRRKTLRNALRGAMPVLSDTGLDRAFELAQVDPSRRAETLSIEEFARLADCIHSLKHQR